MPGFSSYTRLSTASKVMAGLIAALVLAVVVLLLRVRSAEAKRARAALEAVNAAARADTARQVSGRALEAIRQEYGDSVAAVERRAVQNEAAIRSTYDRMTDRYSANVTALQARIRTLETTVAGGPVTTTPEGDRVGAFHVYQEPFTVDVRARLPAPPGLGRLETLRVAVDPIAATLHLQCSERPNSEGIRIANALLIGPAWAGLTLGEIRQSTDVCRSPALERAKVTDADRARVSLAIGVGAVVTAGAPVMPGGSWTVAPGAFAGVAYTKPLGALWHALWPF